MPELVVGRPEAASPLPDSPAKVRPVMLLTFDVPFDRVAVAFALETAAETGAELYICDGVPVPTGNPAVAASRTFGASETRKDSDDVAREARDRGVRTTQLVFHHPRPVHAALEVTRDEQVGLLIFGSDRKRIGRWNFRRIAKRLRKRAPCLVWIPD
ncbi:MAG: universal stress protein [Acidimicrobiia bacterium]